MAIEAIGRCARIAGVVVIVLLTSARAHSQVPVPPSSTPSEARRIDAPKADGDDSAVTDPDVTTPADARRGARPRSGQEPDEPGLSRIGTGRTGGTRRALSIEPGFRLGYVGSDNIDRLPDATRQSGGVAEITPFIGIELHRPGSNLSLNAAARAQQFNGSRFADQRLDGDVAGHGDVEIAGDLLRLRGAGRLFRLEDNGLGATTSGLLQGPRTRNTSVFRELSLSPYTIGQFGTNSDYELAYEYQLIDTGLRNDTNRVYGDLQSNGYADDRLGVTARVDLRRVDYENGFEYDNVSGLLGAHWTTGGRLKLGLGAHYSAIDALRNTSGENSGFGPAVYWDWRASERTVLQGQYARAYYGDALAMRFRQLYSRLLLSATWRKDIEDGNRASTLLFRPVESYSGGRRRGGADERLLAFDDKLALRDLDLGEGAELFTSPLDTALVYDNTVSLAAAFARPRNAAILSLFHSERRAALATFDPGGETELVQYGVYAVFDQSLTARHSVRLITQYVISELGAADVDATSWGADLSWRYTLGPRSHLRFSVRHATRDGEGALASYTENGAGVMFTYQLK